MEQKRLKAYSFLSVQGRCMRNIALNKSLRSDSNSFVSMNFIRMIWKIGLYMDQVVEFFPHVSNRGSFFNAADSDFL